MAYLHIAEKNSIAKEVANLLSNGSKRLGTTVSKFNPVYLFELNDQPHVFSSVRGHIFEYNLPPQCKSWAYFDNLKILTREVPMVKNVNQEMKDLLKNLKILARGKRQLILWLDCDRQGQAIAFEVIDIIREQNPGIRIKRARFSAVTRVDVFRAYNNLVQPNKLQADAVNYRIEIDFRMGCAFTRFQTVTFQKISSNQKNSVISYGPCQMPTLGFVVQRFLQIKYFKPEKYWVISASIILDQKTQVDLRWQRGNVKDEDQAHIMFVNMFMKADQGGGQIMGKVLNRNKHQKKKYRPYPLTTVAFQKLATDKLRLSSAEAMKIAQKLYMAGMISYPRTQTNAFPKTMNLQQLVKRLQGNSTFSGYVNKLLQQGKFMNPKVGSQNDEAHTPIHPVKSVQKTDLTPQEWAVYDLISRHFLACCSKDATGIQSQILVQIGQEYFKASHLTIKQKNYLEIYPFERWIESTFPGQVPQIFLASVQLKENKTKPPSYLTESQLIGLMQKNQIGTDATIHEHIQTIQHRKYAQKSNNTFKPTNLGASLIVTYQQLGLKIQDCHIRRMIEERMDRIAQGNIQRENAVRQTLQQVAEIFIALRMKQRIWLDEMKKALEQN